MLVPTQKLLLDRELGDYCLRPIMNRAVPASKRLAPRQPRLLPCRRKTHFQGHVSPPQRLAQSPTLELCAKLPLSLPYK
ncbi:Bifunctional inhibitor/lipid-transfer protein/seed storage 2S albumin superfamily protein [Prunus dulcis]|uniref:Bifunctional inhibitor/lipid-transfer protein/seed storage 2S albumin superfamily protein n=1 Tax=Prunus dulcis TaxID=3755 RepID=A0A5H2XR62_PRUDU|nr:Bifunctional inhibitor/lipid-transfer protein/seed storage 2S albumin superfamily protein [Prunus dulcis]